MNKPVSLLKFLAQEEGVPAAVLLLPAVTAMETEEEMAAMLPEGD
jgi:hypothetical protein